MTAGLGPASTPLDARRFPLVRLRAPSHFAEELAVVTYRAMDEVLARGQPFVFLYDLRGGGSDPARRRRFAAWAEKNDAAIKAQVVAIGVLVSSQLERGIFTALAWIHTPMVPTRVFSKDEEAERWLMSMLEQGPGKASR